MRFRVRKAAIPPTDRDLFERYCETAVTLVITSGFNPGGELGYLYNDVSRKQNAAQWLTERADIRESHETRIEIIEWAILVFLVVSVASELRWIPSFLKGPW